MDKAQEKAQEMMSFLKKQDSTWLATTILMITIVVTVLSMFSYITGKLQLRELNCTKMETKYTTKPHPTIKSLTNTQKDFPLADYYIKSAYNCCSGGHFKNSYVDTCHLETAIRQGCRVLDFEIYSIDNKPVIATSSIPMIVDNSMNEESFAFKETYNHIPLEDALNIVNKKAFSGDCPNQEDLLFLHFRIKSNNVEMYKNMADTIVATIGGLILPPKYGQEKESYGLPVKPISQILKENKIVIIVDKTNPTYEGTALYDYVNIASGTSNMKKITTFSLLNTEDHDNLRIENKSNLCILIPDTDIKNDNPPLTIANSVGCQMTAMNLSKEDGNRDFYDEFFKKAAFVRKEKEELRYTVDEHENPKDGVDNDPMCEWQDETKKWIPTDCCEDVRGGDCSPPSED